MTWVETRSPSFACRHADGCTQDVARLLAALERQREALAGRFPTPAEETTLVLHDGPRSLLAARPVLGGLWRLTEPASRPCLTGWAGGAEIHLLSPPALRARAAAHPGTGPVLARAAATLYARRVIIAANRDLHRALAPARALVAVRWAWLLEGASRYFSGESASARPLIAARLRSGPAPAFPPSARSAPLLAATVFELVAAHGGERAALDLAGRLDPGGAEGALVRAFGRPLIHSEGAWRAHLARIAGAG